MGADLEEERLCRTTLCDGNEQARVVNLGQIAFRSPDVSVEAPARVESQSQRRRVYVIALSVACLESNIEHTVSTLQALLQVVPSTM